MFFVPPVANPSTGTRGSSHPTTPESRASPPCSTASNAPRESSVAGRSMAEAHSSRACSECPRASLRASNPRTLRSGPHPAKPETQLAKRSRIRTEHGTPLLLAPGGSAFAPSLTHGAGSTPADREEQVRSRFLLATVQNLYGSRLQQGMVPRTRMQNRSRSGGQDPLGG